MACRDARAYEVGAPGRLDLTAHEAVPVNLRKERVLLDLVDAAAAQPLRRLASQQLQHAGGVRV